MTAPNAAIALFLYRRPGHTRLVVEALRRNPGAADSDLYVFCDAARDAAATDAVKAVRAYASAIDGFRSVTVTHAPANRGIAGSIISGISTVFDRHDRIVVVEDDVVLSPTALVFFNAMLGRFEPEPKVAAISGFAHPWHEVPIPAGYPYDVYFTPRLNCWGWATWRNRWRAVKWDDTDADAMLADRRHAAAFRRGGNDLSELWRLHRSGRIDSWAVRWDFHQFRHGLVTLHPRASYARGIGFDGSGVHGTIERPATSTTLSTADQWRLPPAVTLDRRIVWAHKDHYDRLCAGSRFERLLSPAAWWSRCARRRYANP